MMDGVSSRGSGGDLLSNGQVRAPDRGFRRGGGHIELAAAGLVLRAVGVALRQRGVDT